ncbi:MAG: hypothetical protein WAN14_23985 [Candidatus Acidiferrales bacterium]
MMHVDATQFLVLGSGAAFAIWAWRFALILAKTEREVRAAALRGSAKAMGSEFWERGSPYLNELAEELTTGPNSIVHTLQWPNLHVQIFSFQEVRRGTKGRTYYLYWAGYRFSERSFPKFDLKATGTASFLRPGWWRRVSLPSQIDFESRYTLTGQNRPLIEQFFTPARCAAILAREWPRGISLKAGGHWVLVHRETFFNATSESDSETSVAKEIQEVSSLVTGMLPIAEALTDAHLVEQAQRYVRLSEDSLKTKPSWWDRLALLFLAVVIVAAIIVSVAYAGPLLERFDLVILRTEARRYVFAVLFVAALCGIGEWLVRFYRRMKQRAATRLEAQYSVLLNRP